MKNQKINKQNEKNSKVDSLVVAVTGVVVSAGIAVAGVTLADKKNREKVKKIVASAKDSLHKTANKVNNAVKSL